MTTDRNTGISARVERCILLLDAAVTKDLADRFGPPTCCRHHIELRYRPDTQAAYPARAVVEFVCVVQCTRSSRHTEETLFSQTGPEFAPTLVRLVNEFETIASGDGGVQKRLAEHHPKPANTVQASAGFPVMNLFADGNPDVGKA